MCAGMSCCLSQTEEPLSLFRYTYVRFEDPPAWLEYPPAMNMSPPLSSDTKQCMYVLIGIGLSVVKELPSRVASKLELKPVSLAPPDITKPKVESYVPEPRASDKSFILRRNRGLNL